MRLFDNQCIIELVARLLLQGKSLSLICGALTWLQDFEERKKAELQLLLEEVDDLKYVSAVPCRLECRSSTLMYGCFVP